METTNSASLDNWTNNGYLGVTAEDFIAVGDTPDEILVKNPGKTLGELMTEEEIEEFLLDTMEAIESNEEDIKSNTGDIKTLKEDTADLIDSFAITVEYLNSIGKLPPSFDY